MKYGMVAENCEVIPVPFQILDENPKMVVDGEGQLICTAINPYIAKMIRDMINSHFDGLLDGPMEIPVPEETKEAV